MSSTDQEIAAYNQALIRALRSTDPIELRRFATTWGARLGNRGLKQLAKATDELVERRMWMMIADRPDLGDLQLHAMEWLEEHPESESS
jgi:hypothetical protein